MCLYWDKKVETPYQFQILFPTTESTPNEMSSVVDEALPLSNNTFCNRSNSEDTTIVRVWVDFFVLNFF